MEIPGGNDDVPGFGLRRNVGARAKTRGAGSAGLALMGAGVLGSRRMRYVVVGGFNTLIGYSIGVGLYTLLSPRLHILLIGTLANILAISVSFATYKRFVFRTQGQWLREYLRSYVVYGGMAVVSIVLLWVLVDGFSLPIWLSQGMAIIVTVLISYIGHARFTFRLPNDTEPRYRNDDN